MLDVTCESSAKQTIHIGHLEKNGFRCICKSPHEFSSSADCAKFIKKSHTSLAIGVHAYKAGRWLKDAEIPYAIILGGTDVNEMSRDREKLIVMTDVLKKASFIVAFNASLLKILHKWPFFDSSRYSIIPQAVSVFPSSFSVQTYIRVNHRSIICDDFTHIFIMTGGIRPVKNPLYVVEQFSEWQKHCCVAFRSLLVIVGPVADERYFTQFKSEIDKHPEIVYIPGLSIEDCHAAIKDSFCLVNSSDSEGMAISILEAMVQGTPVLVRDNQGNCSIVQDGKTGLVYTTPQEFIEKAEELLRNTVLYKTLVQNAFEYVQKDHSLEFEENEYLQVIRKVKDTIQDPAAN